MTPQKNIRVVLADDHAMLREGLRGLLQQHGIEVLAEAADGQTAIELTQNCQPDVLLLDINMPGMNGLQAAKCVKQLKLNTKVVMLTMSDAEDDMRAALDAEVSGYISKTASPTMLENALRLVVEGETVFPQRAISYKPRSQPTLPQLAQLTQREHQILLCVARGLSNKTIARELDLAEGTVKVHIKAILRKLDLANRTQAAVYVLKKMGEAA
jgi:two-component system nitrate/nitrite response regulator NarL